MKFSGLLSLKQDKNLVRKLFSRQTSNLPMAIKNQSKTRFKFTLRRAFGVLLTLLAVGFLGFLSFFFYTKYTTPPVLATYLPSEGTFFYAELQTDTANADWQMLRQIFATAAPAELLPLDELGLSDPTGLLALSEQRVGIAFLGESFDPSSYLLVLDVSQPTVALTYLKEQALAGEQLVTQTYFGVPVYSYPRSGEQVFALLGTDLLLASNRDVLQQVLAAARGSKQRISDTESYSTVIKRLNPRAVGFAYLSEVAARQIVAARLGGIQNALTTPLLELFQAGGVELVPTPTGITLTTYLALRPSYAREPLFKSLPRFESDLLRLLPATTQTFYASRDLAGQLANFLVASKQINSAFALLTVGYLDTLSQVWLGQSASFADTVAPLLGGEVLAGQTDTGARFFILNNSHLGERLPSFVEALSAGKLATRTQGVILPDGTTGRQLVAAPNLTTRTTAEYNGVEVTSLIFRGQQTELHYALLDGLLLAATEQNLLEELIDQQVSQNISALSSVIAAADLPTEEIFYRQLRSATGEINQNDSRTLRLLKPFYYLLAGKQATVDGLTFTFFLGQ